MSSQWLTRAETLADIPVIREITLAAFPTAQEADIIDGLRADPAWIDGLSLVSTDENGRVVGHALLTRCQIGDVPALMLGPVAVRPEDQNQGAGSAAIRAALSAAREKGENHIVVVGHPDYYPRFGFVRASTQGIGLTIEAPDDAVMALSTDAGNPLPSGLVRFAKPFGI